MIVNEVKRKLANGQVVIGSFVFVSSATLTEIIGLSGFDFVVIDMEHGPVDIGVTENMIRAAELVGVTPFVRVSHNTSHLILRALDVGAQGVHVPDIGDAESARAMVANVKYSPEGHRGLGGVRAAKYGLQDSLAEYAATANQETMVIAHIEHVKAIEKLDELLIIEGIDVYFVGPTDLSNSLGIPGQTKDPKVVNLVEDAIKRIAAAGKTPGCIAADSEKARHYIDLGARYMATHAVKLMATGCQQFIKEVLL